MRCAVWRKIGAAAAAAGRDANFKSLILHAHTHTYFWPAGAARAHAAVCAY